MEPAVGEAQVGNGARPGEGHSAVAAAGGAAPHRAAGEEGLASVQPGNEEGEKANMLEPNGLGALASTRAQSTVSLDGLGGPTVGEGTKGQSVSMEILKGVAGFAYAFGALHSMLIVLTCHFGHAAPPHVLISCPICTKRDAGHESCQ